MFLKISLHRTKYQHLLPVSNYLQSIFLFLVTISVGKFSGEALQLNLLESKFYFKKFKRDGLNKKGGSAKNLGN